MLRTNTTLSAFVVGTTAVTFFAATAFFFLLVLLLTATRYVRKSFFFLLLLATHSTVFLLCHANKTQEDVALPTAPWEAGAPLHGRDDELQEQWRSQSQGQGQGQYQEAQWARGVPGPGGAGASAGGGGSFYAGSEVGGTGRSEASLSVYGFNTDREGMSRGYRSPPRRRRASPLLSLIHI